MLLFYYLLFEFGYYLYCRFYIYNVLNNIDYNQNRQVITEGLSAELSAELYAMFKDYFTKEEDLVKFFTDAIPNKRLLTLENIKKLMSYHIYNRHPDSNTDIEYDNLNEILDIIKPKLGSLIQPDIYGNNTNDIISPHYQINKLSIIHKPAVFYLLMYLIRRLANFYMRMLGFTNITDVPTQLRVWIKTNKNAVNKTPLIFIHGLGFGIVLYLFKIPMLSVDRETVIIPELPNISYDLYKFPPVPIETIVSAFYDILVTKNIKLVDIIGHSYGGIILNIFQLRYPEMCNYKTYIESPVFCIQQSHTAKLIYTRQSPIHIRKYIMYLLVLSDTYVQYTAKRDLFSEQGIIKNLDDKTTVILAKDDYLVPSYYIHRYITLNYPQVKAIMIEGDHGAYIFG
jgi:pimeloyl-ACP methyl ester carboxylesterase